jgi:hypothetical protein
LSSLNDWGDRKAELATLSHRHKVDIRVSCAASKIGKRLCLKQLIKRGYVIDIPEHFHLVQGVDRIFDHAAPAPATTLRVAFFFKAVGETPPCAVISTFALKKRSAGGAFPAIRVS